jgi:hypothetical protein
MQEVKAVAISILAVVLYFAILAGCIKIAEYVSDEAALPPVNVTGIAEVSNV